MSKIKKFSATIVGIFAFVLLAATNILPAAASSSDIYFEGELIGFEENQGTNTKWGVKENATSHYIKNSGVKQLWVRSHAYKWGNRYNTTSNDGYGYSCNAGTERGIYNRVYERFGWGTDCYLDLTTTSPGTWINLSGCWSADSIGFRR